MLEKNRHLHGRDLKEKTKKKKKRQTSAAHI